METAGQRLIKPVERQFNWIAKERPGNYVTRWDGRIERVCEHGVGHTVSVRYVKKDKDAEYWWIHGCDGCCRTWPCEDCENGPFGMMYCERHEGEERNDEDY